MLELLAYIEHLNSILVPFLLLPLNVISLYHSEINQNAAMIYIFQCILIFMFSLEISTFNFTYKDIASDSKPFLYITHFVYVMANIGKMILSSMILFYFHVAGSNISLVYYIVIGQTILTFLLMAPLMIVYFNSDFKETYITWKRKMHSMGSNNYQLFQLNN